LLIDVPRSLGLLADHYYELVVMPVGPATINTGFLNVPNVVDTMFKMIAYDMSGFSFDSCEHIDKIYPYTRNVFTLGRIYYVTSRPQTPTALLI